jgi:hypothetical protein
MKKIIIAGFIAFGLFVGWLHFAHAALIISDITTPTSTISVGGDNAFFDGTTSATTTASYIYVRIFLVGHGSPADGIVAQLLCINGNVDCINADGYATGTSQTIIPNQDFGNPAVWNQLDGNFVTIRYPTTGGCCGSKNLGGYIPNNDFFSMSNAFSAATYWGRSPANNGFLAGNGFDGLYGCLASTVAEAVNCTPSTPSPPSISFLYPVDGSTTPQFSPWLVQVENMTSTNHYSAIVHWSMRNHIANPSNLVGVSFQFSGNQVGPPSFSDSVSDFFGNSTGTVPIPKADRDLYSYPLVIPANDDLWSASAYLYDTTQGGGFLASSTISFTMLRYGAIYDGVVGKVGTTTYYIPQINASGTLQITTTTNNFTGGLPSSAEGSSTCVAATGITDVPGGLRYGLCETALLLFDPNTIPASKDFIANQLNLLKAVPPFAAFFQTASATLDAVNNPTSTQGFTIGFLDLQGNQRTLVNLNSTTFYGGFASSNNPTVNRATTDYLEYYIHAWLGIAALIKVLVVFLT